MQHLLADPDPVLLAHARSAVPRYTSYPTAPHFSAAVGPAVYGDWLAELGRGPETALSLYLHVPFCRDLCAYCGCHTKATHREEPVRAFAAVLLEEIALVGRRIGRPLPVSHIHWGGGTPSMLPADCLRAVVARLKEYFIFRPDMEHAIELDPRLVDERLVETLAEVGITRASLGVQDVEPQVQAAIHRVQPLAQVERAVALLRGAGITALNFDLIYGLPHQTAETVRRTAECAADLAPDRLAVFGYAHVPWMKANQKLIDEAALPGAVARIALEEIMRDTLMARGYRPVGIDHFVRPDDPMAEQAVAGTLRRNFQGYTTDAAPALIGFGPSSIGRLPMGYAQNVPDTGGWERLVMAGEPPIVRGHAFSDEDRLRAAVIERLMTDFAVDTDAVAADLALPAELLGDWRPALERVVEDGIAEVTGPEVRVTPRGRPVARVVAAAFDAYLATGKARHSVAV
ncbi:oxygen-independent coproporphyrinogen III oxidase [Segnochrobactraceae bacterium EtOH-i3]